MQIKKLCIASAVAAVLSSAAYAADQPLSEQLNDAQREGRIYASYALNRHLNPFELKVDVNGNKAMLSGTVEDSVDKDLAEQIALSVSGIKSVDNQIKVDESVKPVARKAGERTFGETVEDATITAGIKSKLLWNEHTSGMKIDVDTNAGVVTLTGRADSDASKDLAGYLAENTEGVRDVNNRLTIATDGKDRSTAQAAGDKTQAAGDKVSDAWITTKVKSSLLYSKSVSGNDIHVKTNQGVVTLTGKVDADSERDLAVELAKNIRGVKKVDASDLEVSTRQTAGR